MLEYLSVDKIFLIVPVLNYPMSYIEFAGTIFYLWSVWLIAKKQMLTWPIGIISVLLYLALFYQIRLYADTLEQVYYLGASLYGWWYWRAAQKNAGTARPFRYSSRRTVLVWVGLTLMLSALSGWMISQWHLWLPALFPEPASFPYLDALTTVMSFVAMALMAQKRVESWIYWISVDIIGIGLYYVKDVRFVAVLYVILLGMALNGWWGWRTTAKAAAAG